MFIVQYPIKLSGPARNISNPSTAMKANGG